MIYIIRDYRSCSPHRKAQFPYYYVVITSVYSQEDSHDIVNYDYQMVVWSRLPFNNWKYDLVT